MENLLTACACGLDPGSEAMLVQAGLAVVVSTPLWFQASLVRVFRKLTRRGDTGGSSGCSGGHTDVTPE